MISKGNVRMMCTIPIRVFGVLGFDNRRNDVVYCAPTMEPNGTTVFFGGDVQNFKEDMEAHEINTKHVQWNLEDTATLLNKSFPNSHMVVIRPSRMEHQTFSCFDNFVRSMKYGVPDFVPNHQAVHHLYALLENLSREVENFSVREIEDSISKSSSALDNIQSSSHSQAEINRNFLNLDTIRLIGFSKGCVVLNQLLHEFHHFKTHPSKDEVATNFIHKIKEMYWLDGGHSGQKNTWITSVDILRCYARLGIKTLIHVTPYQVEDSKRPWIKQEESDFHNILRKLGVDVHRELHFSDIPSLDSHFNVLKVLRNYVDISSECSKS